MNDHPRPARAWRAPSAFASLGCCALALAACGGSSSPKTPSGSSAAATTAGPGGQRFAAARACLQKQGITMPQRPDGAQRGPGGGPGGGAGGGLFGTGAGGGGAGANGGPRAAFNTPAFRAAASKCGLTAGRFRRNPAARRAAITTFAACVRQNGYNLPAPNFSGTGPVFRATQVNRNDPRFVAASQKCVALLRPGGAAGGGAPGPATG